MDLRPPTGKTILSSTIIEDLKKSATQSATTVLYFYFDFNDSSKQSFEKMLCSLVSQLYQRCETSRRHLDQLFSSCKGGQEQPSTQELTETLQIMINDTSSVAIVLDALDECEARRTLLDWLALPKSGNMRILLTSREEDDIKTLLSKWMPPGATLPIQQKPVDNDIRKVVRSRIAEDEDLQRWKDMPLVQDEIETTLMTKAGGMFRWAACQLEVLKDCRHLRSLRKALSSLPQDLDETYSRILESISETDRTDAIRVLQFLTFSARPLRLDEVVDAIAVNPEERSAFQAQSRMPFPQEIARVCSSLVKITTRFKGTGYDSEGKAQKYVVTELQLAHFSVKEYLVSVRVAERYKASFRAPHARAEIVRVSITYLLAAAQHAEYDDTRGTLPLERLAARHWMYHAAVSEANEVEIWPHAKELFDAKHAYLYWLSRFDPEWGGVLSGELPQSAPPPLYYVCLAGLYKLVKALLTDGADVNAQGGQYGNALQAASVRGHRRVVQLLLANGANVNAEGGFHKSALLAASAKGHMVVVKSLIAGGASNERGIYYTARQIAFLFGPKLAATLEQ